MDLSVPYGTFIIAERSSRCQVCHVLVLVIDNGMVVLA
jgi:hypothetical protein